MNALNVLMRSLVAGGIVTLPMFALAVFRVFAHCDKDFVFMNHRRADYVVSVGARQFVFALLGIAIKLP